MREEEACGTHGMRRLWTGDFMLIFCQICLEDRTVTFDLTHVSWDWNCLLFYKWMSCFVSGDLKTNLKQELLGRITTMFFPRGKLRLFIYSEIHSLTSFL